jgi:hypothetical protein
VSSAVFQLRASCQLPHGPAACSRRSPAVEDHQRTPAAPGEHRVEGRGNVRQADPLGHQRAQIQAPLTYVLRQQRQVTGRVAVAVRLNLDPPTGLKVIF